MAKSSGQKRKLLCLLQILQEYTDSEHLLSTQELIDALERYDIHAERKSIYDDIACLNEMGYEIISAPSRVGGGYYLASRDLELAELKLLVDVVQSSRFLSEKKSRSLIGKLEKMASKYEAQQLQRQVYVAGRVRTGNESIFYNVDTIHRGIQENKQITFHYLDWNIHKELVKRQRGEKQVSPYMLIWKDENYYLVAYDAADGVMKHYRVDKMEKTRLTNLPREGREQFEQLDVTTHYNQMFGMYNGEQETVTLEFPERLLGTMLDRFGKDAAVRGMTDGQVRIRVQVALSGQFYGWLAGIGSDLRIVAPDKAVEGYGHWLRDILKAYK